MENMQDPVSVMEKNYPAHTPVFNRARLRRWLPLPVQISKQHSARLAFRSFWLR